MGTPIHKPPHVPDVSKQPSDPNLDANSVMEDLKCSRVLASESDVLRTKSGFEEQGACVCCSGDVLPEFSLGMLMSMLERFLLCESCSQSAVVCLHC